MEITEAKELIEGFNQTFQEAENSTDANQKNDLFEKCNKIAYKINDIAISNLPEKTSRKYTKETVQRLAIVAVIKENCLFMTDLSAFMPMCRELLYEHGIHKMDIVKDAITNNKIKVKHSMRAKWYKSENATLNIALYKLISNEDELSRLTMNNIKLDDGLFDGDSKEDLQDLYIGNQPEPEEFDLEKEEG